MTVEELIEDLKDYDPKAIVVLDATNDIDYEYSYHVIEPARYTMPGIYSDMPAIYIKD